MSVQKFSHFQLFAPVDSPAKVTGKVYACLLCRRRRVKCDRASPCSNCSKAGAECEYHDPPPPRRRKRKELDIPAEVRLQRYEDALRRCGLDPDEVADPSRSDEPRQPGSGVSSPDVTIEREPSEANDTSITNTEPRSGKLVTKHGGYIYLDNNLWNTVSNEFRDIGDSLLDGSGNAVDEICHKQLEDPLPQNKLLIFGIDSPQNLSDSHPNPIQIFKLWQTFLENVNPLTKVIHVPTLQPQILAAASDLGSISGELEALMFSIYSVALRSLDEEEAFNSFGDTKANLIAHYQACTQKSLLNAGLLKTSKIMVLQALHFFLLSALIYYDPYELWALSALELRIAQRIGLHRDGSMLGLTVFETEFRRRLWWQVVIMDATMAHKCGASSLLLPSDIDTRSALNLNDSDLYPTMKEFPPESDRPTEMIFCLVRYEFGQWLQNRSCSRRISPESYWDSVSGSTVPNQVKEDIIKELEASLEDKILRHCDSSVPLHLMTALVARMIIINVRFTAYHPRRYTENGITPTLSQRQHLFAICINQLEHNSMLIKSKQASRFFWHLDVHFPSDIVVHLFSELRYRTAADEDTAKAWQLIDIACARQYEPRRRVKNPLHPAIAELAVRAWDAHVTLSRSRAIAPVPQPAIISIFQKIIRRPDPSLKAPPTGHTVSTSASTETPITDLHTVQSFESQSSRDPSGQTVISSQSGADRNLHQPDPSHEMHMSLDFLDDLFGTGTENSFQYNPLDWSKWDEFLNQSQRDIG